jgi:hypothetical protein
MGFCHSETDWDALFTRFASMQDALIALMSEIPGLGDGDRRIVGAYLKSFFKILDSPKTRKRMIENACQPWPDSVMR